MIELYQNKSYQFQELQASIASDSFDLQARGLTVMLYTQVLDFCFETVTKICPVGSCTSGLYGAQILFVSNLRERKALLSVLFLWS